MHSNHQFFAEIIEGNLSEWIGQCWKWDNMPTFGSLVTTSHGPLEIFGIVHTIRTGSMDPIRFPTAYGKTEQELQREQPQIFEFLQTTFTCVTVGYKKDHRFFYHLPDHPPKIHAFIGNPNEQTLQQFFAHEQFLHLLFNLLNQQCNLHELLLALLKNLHEKKCLDKNKFHDFIETFATLSKHDYQKLRLFLHRTSYLFDEQNL